MEQPSETPIKFEQEGAGKRALTVAIINNMPFIQTPFFESSVSLLFETSKKTELNWMNVKAFPVDFARNWAVKRFLNASDYKTCEWFGWLDIDMTFPRDAFNIMLDDCIKNNRKVMSAVYFKRNFKNEVVAWRYNDRHEVEEPLLDGTVQEVEIIGMGCMVVHRSVLEKIMYPWYKYGPLHETVENLATEDIHFCVRCNEIGEKIWVHTGIICGHIMQIENVHNRLVPLSMTDNAATITLPEVSNDKKA